MKQLVTVLSLLGGIVIMNTACSKSDSGGNSNNGGGGITYSCAGITPKFAADVQPILTSVCASNANCHAAGSANSGGPFTTHAQVDAKKSNIKAAILSGSMPKNTTLSQTQINNFICWIDNGAPNN
jgi:hypothetical protein